MNKSWWIPEPSWSPRGVINAASQKRDCNSSLNNTAMVVLQCNPGWSDQFQRTGNQISQFKKWHYCLFGACLHFRIFVLHFNYIKLILG